MSFRTPVQIENFLEEHQYRFDMPQQYYGDEPNSYSPRSNSPFKKDWESAKVRMLLYASWPYEQAAGNQSIPLVYKTVNEASPDFLCDRSYFAAAPRDWRIFAKAGMPMFGIEHRHQMRDYDVLGTSISYPVLAINAMKQLQASDIPIRWSDRTAKANEFPMVIVGGQSFGAPEGLSNCVDAYWCGEVEDEPDNPGIGAFLRRIQDFKESGAWTASPESRIECYAELAREFNCLYIPRFIDIHYEYEENRTEVSRVIGRDALPSKQVVGYSTNIAGMKIPVKKRFVKDMDKVSALDNPPLLYIDPGMGAGDLEVGRGCPAWCSFCALTYRQKPYRQRSVDYMTKFGQQLIRNTGGNHLAPFSPDFPMHTNKKKLIASLLANVTDEVDASSMRVDDFIADSDYILLQAHGGMDQVTLGVEGNSQRMRDLVGKGCADEDIKEAVARGIRAGIRRFKLYMICDLPGEDEGDIYRILDLAKELADIRDSMGQHTVKIQFSWTPLLVEANTPFQWFAPTITNRALGQVWDEFRDIKIDFKLGSKSEKNKQTYFQLNQRSSRDAGMAIVDVVEAMDMPCWGGVAKGTYEALEESLKKHGFHNGYGDVFDERKKNDMFGWEWLDQGINVELLWITYQQMKEFLENTDSDTYDQNFDSDYHGSEWIERCDTKCVAEGTLVTLADGTQETIESVFRRVRAGDRVMVASHDEHDGSSVPAHVSDAHDNGVRDDMLSIELDNGTELQVTSDHLILTSRGWVQAQHLTTEDEILEARPVLEPVERDLLQLDSKTLTRFMDHVVVDEASGCWNSSYAPNSSGYTFFYLSRERTRVPMHRVALEAFKGLLAPGEDPDHVCKNRRCVNPEHLRHRPQWENRQGDEASKRFCKNGHEYTAANTYVTTYKGTNERQCKACRADRARRLRAAGRIA